MTVAMLLSSATMSAQMGRTFPSEKKVIKDPKTGTELVFLTSKPGTGDSKIYQTHNQWTADGKWVIFRSMTVPSSSMTGICRTRAQSSQSNKSGVGIYSLFLEDVSD